jgi:hypothetical protein
VTWRRSAVSWALGPNCAPLGSGAAGTAPASLRSREHYSPMPQQDAYVFQVLISYMGKRRDSNPVLSKTLHVLGHAELFEPACKVMHSAAPRCAGDRPRPGHRLAQHGRKEWPHPSRWSKVGLNSRSTSGSPCGPYVCYRSFIARRVGGTMIRRRRRREGSPHVVPTGAGREEIPHVARLHYPLEHRLDIVGAGVAPAPGSG